jgi:adapter protein MecA 1/2
MKIEMINERQIRCTLTRDDLADRQMRLSELAYGTEKAQNLFKDMIQQASYEFGFEAENIPLMIEAIPMNGECLILIITKVEDPEELDTRFSKFAPSVQNETNSIEDLIESLVDGADEVLDLFRKMHNEHLHGISGNSGSSTSLIDKVMGGRNNLADKEIESGALAVGEPMRVFSLDSLPVAISVSKILANVYKGESTLYKRPHDGYFILILAGTDAPTAEYSKTLNILSEHAYHERAVYATEAYIKEHFELIIADSAIQDLSRI